MSDKKLDDKKIFNVAREILSDDARSEYLSLACGGDELQLERIEALLDGFQKDPQFLESPILQLDENISIESEIGPYKLREQIGEGGMGIVYVAQQTHPVRRKVALKIIKPGIDSKEVIGRFEAERQALAMMDHPNIAKVLDAGSTSTGRPYFVMDLVRGLPITKYCDKYRLTTVDRLKLFMKVCSAVQHAHQKGIIHRDIKPSNLLVTRNADEAIPKVIDFGVAKAINQQLTDHTVYTHFSQMIGTPMYMSPEQAEMSELDADTRSDIYSLGVVLYEILTGSTPFDKDSLYSVGYDEMRRIIREVDPPRPSERLSTLSAEAISTVSKSRRCDVGQIQKRLRGEIDWIVMKSLDKDRSRRYMSANDFAADIQRFINGEPVAACPPSAVYKLRKAFQKHVFAVLTLATVFVLLVAGIASTSWQWQRATANANQMSLLAQSETDERIKAQTAQAEAERQREIAVEAKRISDLHLYVGQIRLSKSEWEYGDTLIAIDTLNSTRKSLRSWEYGYLKRVFDEECIATGFGHTDNITCVKFSPDDCVIASGSKDHSIKLWKADTCELIRTLDGHTKSVRDIGFSPDGKTLASCGMDKTICIWNIETGKLLRSIDLADLDHGSAGLITFHPNGKKFATSNTDCTISVWEVETGQESMLLKGHEGDRIISMEFNSDGTKIRSASRDNTVSVWDVDGIFAIPKRIIGLADDSATFDGHVLNSGHKLETFGIEFSPDNQTVATSSWDRTVRIWDANTQDVLRVIKGHRGYAFGIKYIGDGKQIVSACDDRILRIWDVLTGDLVRVLRGHKDHIREVSVNNSGTRIVSGSWDNTIKVWSSEPIVDRNSWKGGGKNWISGTAISPDGQYLASCAGSRVRLWDFKTRKLLFQYKGHTGQTNGIAFIRGTNWLVSCSQDHTLRIWSVITGELIRELTGHSDIVFDLAVSTDGSQIVSGGNDGTVKIWDVDTWQEVASFEGEYLVQSVAISPDKSMVAAVGHGKLRMWDTRSGKLVHVSDDGLRWVFSLAFSPDGTRIASGGYSDGLIRLWNVETKEQIKSWNAHSNSVKSLTFSPDGKRIISGGADGTAKVWDAELGELLVTLEGNGDAILSVTASSDGQYIISGDEGGLLKIWSSTKE